MDHLGRTTLQPTSASRSPVFRAPQRILMLRCDTSRAAKDVAARLTHSAGGVGDGGPRGGDARWLPCTTAFTSAVPLGEKWLYARRRRPVRVGSIQQPIRALRPARHRPPRRHQLPPVPGLWVRAAYARVPRPGPVPAVPRFKLAVVDGAGNAHPRVPPRAGHGLGRAPIAFASRSTLAVGRRIPTVDPCGRKSRPELTVGSGRLISPRVT